MPKPSAKPKFVLMEYSKKGTTLRALGAPAALPFHGREAAERGKEIAEKIHPNNFYEIHEIQSYLA